MIIFETELTDRLLPIEEIIRNAGGQSRRLAIWSRTFFICTLPDRIRLQAIELLTNQNAKLMTETNSESPLSSKLIKKDFSSFEIANGVEMASDKTLFIGGPCAVESRSQIDETASRLSSLGVKALRAGAFKPRTSIYSFQGLEYDGLKLLKETADKYHMIVVTEAKDTSHIDAVIEYADVVQVGAKSMYNFDLLRRAGESGKTVMLKRGFMTTIKEYMQALDVILATGNSRVIMCERGLRTFETQTRFTLDLAGAAVLKISSHLPLVIDPSHTTGRRDIVASLSQAALALGVEGLLVEIHPNPEQALSDREQAFPLADVPDLLKRLRLVANSVDRVLT